MNASLPVALAQAMMPFTPDQSVVRMILSAPPVSRDREVFESVQMRRCRVRVDGVDYTGIFADTCTAVMDAQERFPAARRISAGVLL